MNNDDYRDLTKEDPLYGHEESIAALAKLEEDERRLALMRELLDIDIYMLEGYQQPRYLMQGAPNWDWKHHEFVINSEGLQIAEFARGMEPQDITLDASEAEKLCSILLGWWLERRRKKMGAPLGATTTENEHPS